MDEVILETELRVPPAKTFDFLRDFPGYVRYSSYLDDVSQHGDGSVGTRYELLLSWWKLSYTAHTEVTAIEEPHRIEWRVLRAVDARGHWAIEPIDPPGQDGTHSLVRLYIQYDPASADPGAIDIPRLVSLGWIVDRVKPLIVPEAESIVERIVADLEGEPRPVDLDIQVRTD